MISYLISKRYQPVPLYRALLEQDDVHMPLAGTRQTTDHWQAREVMTQEFTLVSPDSSIQLASGIVVKTNAESLPIGSNGVFSGLVTRDQIERALTSGAANDAVGTIVTDNCAHVHPDHPFDLVLDRLARNPGLLPVVSRIQVNRLEGVITPQSVLQFLQREFEGSTDVVELRAKKK
jgi:predicted transcriptional regulator